MFPFEDHQKETFARERLRAAHLNATLIGKCVAVVIAAILTLSAAPGQAAVEFEKRPAEAIETDLPACRWLDKDRSVKSVVLLLHGLSQRSLTLERVAEEFATRDCVTYGLDLRGHGWWHHGRVKGDEGFEIDYTGSLADVKRFIFALKKEYPDVPLFVVGESVGASVALRAAAEEPESIDGLILCGAGSRLCRVKMAWFLPDLVKGLFRRQLNLVRYQREYGTDDLAALNVTIEDPLQRKTFSLKEFWRARGCLSKNVKFAKKLDPQMPVLLIQGENDRTLKVKSAKKVFDAIPGEDKELVIVPNSGHILLGTPRPKPIVTSAMTRFIAERSNSMVAGREQRSH